MEFSTPSFERLCCCCCQRKKERKGEEGKPEVRVSEGNNSRYLPYYMPQRWAIAFFAFAADFICYMDRANISATMIPMAELYGWSKTSKGSCLVYFSSA